MDFSLSETAFLVILGLLLFGPKKLPEIGRHIGRWMAEFKRASAEFQNQLNDEVRQWEDQVEETKRSILPPLNTTAREEPGYKTIEAAPIAPAEETIATSHESGQNAQAEPETEADAPESLSSAVTQGPHV